MRARIICGDVRDVLPTLPDASVDVCIADPPYGETSLKWDRRVPGWPALVRRLLKPHGSLWVFGSLRSFMATLGDFEGWQFAQDLVWEKHNGSNNAADRFKRVHESVAQFYPAGVEWSVIYKEPQFTPDATRRQVRRKKRPPHWGNIGESVYVSEDGGPRHMRSVIYCRSMHGRAVHETHKPPEFLEPIIRYSCPHGGTVLDLFAGSGAATAAALRCGRKSIAIEGRPECADVARKWITNDAPLWNAPAIETRRAPEGGAE